MDGQHSPLLHGNQANLRFCNVSRFSTELLELHSEKPTLHILVIPGNPGIISYYKDFVEALYKLLDGKASVTAIGHISHTGKDWENGRAFSLQEQIDHKVDFIKQEYHKMDIPFVMVGHSIGSYICLKILKRFEDQNVQVRFTIGLYPFLTLNKDSQKQSYIGFTAKSTFLCTIVSRIVALLGLCPSQFTSALVRRSIGQSWSAAAVSATCYDLLKHHTMRNVLYMAETEFEKLSEDLDWVFMRKKQSEVAFLFGIDDHWGPLSLYEEVSRQVPGISLTIEREGHTHSFCCTEAGSIWVAEHVADLIRKHLQIKTC